MVLQRLKSLMWGAGVAALVVDAAIRFAQYADARAHEAPVDAVVQDELERALQSVAERAYRAGYQDGIEAAD